MGSIPEESVVCKCLNLLDLKQDRDLFLDVRTRKLTTGVFIKLMIEGQLNRRRSFDNIREHLRASGTLQHTLGLDDISGSQLSRKLSDLPYQIPQALFLQAVEKLHQRTRDQKGIAGIGRLAIIDSSELTLPEVAGQWAYCSKHKNAVKMHTRYIVTDQHTGFPDRIIASTADVADSEISVELVVADDAIYVMDRGYIVYKNYKAWNEQNIRFVGRIQQRNKTVVLRERQVSESSKIMRDADVKVSFKEQGQTKEVELRLIEFRDDKGRMYRLLTNVQDLSAEQVSEIYRHRWKIELFFKWIKQHLKLVKLHSAHPEAIWTQMYLALLAYALVLLVKLETGSERSLWQVLDLLGLYAEKTWQEFLDALFRKPTRVSNGRRKKGKPGRPRKHPKKLKGARLVVR